MTNQVKTTLVPYYPEYMADNNLGKLDFYLLSKIRNLTEYTSGKGFDGHFYQLKKIACVNQLPDEEIKASLRKLLDDGYISRTIRDDGSMILCSIIRNEVPF